MSITLERLCNYIWESGCWCVQNSWLEHVSVHWKTIKKKKKTSVLVNWLLHILDNVKDELLITKKEIVFVLEKITQNTWTDTYTDDPLMCAIRGDDGSIESNQRWQSLGHPVSDHSHGAEHRANLQHGNTHPNTHTFTHRTHRNSGSHTQSKLLTAIMLVKRAHARDFSAPQSKV